MVSSHKKRGQQTFAPNHRHPARGGKSHQVSQGSGQEGGQGRGPHPRKGGRQLEEGHQQDPHDQGQHELGPDADEIPARHDQGVGGARELRRGYEEHAGFNQDSGDSKYNDGNVQGDDEGWNY